MLDQSRHAISGQPVAPIRIGSQVFAWGERTFVMGILNATPDSFSGDGLLSGAIDLVRAAVERGQQMIDDGADLLDVGGESTRPGHAPVADEEEIARVVPIVAALHAVLPGTPLSVDTTKVRVAAAALDAGANLINDVWGVGPDEALIRLAVERGVPIVLMHNRVEARYADLMAEVIAELRAAIDRAERIGLDRHAIIVDPGFGFGKTADHNLTLVRELHLLRALGRPILLGASRKSTLGKILDLPPDERLEATLATTALGVAGGVDIVRVHDVRANVRVARMSDAIVREPRPTPEGDPP